jgi:hypothetical protein
MNTITKIIKYEQGDLDETEMIHFFQELIDSGMVWELQGSYGRTANDLIKGGFCWPANIVND